MTYLWNENFGIWLNLQVEWQSYKEATEGHPTSWNLQVLVTILIASLINKINILNKVIDVVITMRSGFLPALSINNTLVMTAGIWKKRTCTRDKFVGRILNLHYKKLDNTCIMAIPLLPMLLEAPAQNQAFVLSFSFSDPLTVFDHQKCSISLKANIPAFSKMELV